jgi:hypothetical protein
MHASARQGTPMHARVLVSSSLFYQLFGFFSLLPIYRRESVDKRNGSRRPAFHVVVILVTEFPSPGLLSFSSDLGVSSTPITTTSFSFAFHFLI